MAARATYRRVVISGSPILLTPSRVQVMRCRRTDQEEKITVGIGRVSMHELVEYGSAWWWKEQYSANMCSTTFALWFVIPECFAKGLRPLDPRHRPPTTYHLIPTTYHLPTYHLLHTKSG